MGVVSIAPCGIGAVRCDALTWPARRQGEDCGTDKDECREPANRCIVANRAWSASFAPTVARSFARSVAPSVVLTAAPAAAAATTTTAPSTAGPASRATSRTRMASAPTSTSAPTKTAAACRSRTAAGPSPPIRTPLPLALVLAPPLARMSTQAQNIPSPSTLTRMFNLCF